MTSECIWSSYEVIVSYFIQTSTVLNELHMKYIWNYHVISMKFIWSSLAIRECSPVQIYHEVQNKVIWSSHEIYMKFK